VGEIEISTDSSRLDLDAIHAYLSTSYWGAGRSRELIEKSLGNSLCFGAYDGNVQIGLARVVTDRATFAYLCDVYVLESHRGRGIGKKLMQAVVAHPDLQGLRRFHLVTRDAHGLYEQFGFTALAQPERHMERTVKA
jgi:GNAT superfamily N-acetyltransferase